MKRLGFLMALIAVCGLVLIASSQNAQARAQYPKALAAKYEKVKDEVTEKKCAVCHGDEGKNKKILSDYAKALREALGEKNVKDAEKINEALDAVGKKDAGDGKSYADLLNNGKLPPPAKE